jgi:hypothetical protein
VFLVGTYNENYGYKTRGANKFKINKENPSNLHLQNGMANRLAGAKMEALL